MLLSVLCAALTACGGGSGDAVSAPPVQLAQGGTIPAGAEANYPIAAPAATASMPALDAADQAVDKVIASGSVPVQISVPAEDTEAARSSTVQGATLPAGAAAFPGSGTAPTPGTGSQIANVTSVTLISTSATPQTSTPVTFGQVFAAGHVKSTEILSGKTSTGANVPLQVDVKARHPDGSLRHAVITAVLPSSLPKQAQVLNLIKSSGAVSSVGAAPTALLNAGFTASFSATIGGKQYTASADQLLKTGKYTTWLAGPLANEWLVLAPLKTASGEEHPHLAARFAIRAYQGNSTAKVDVAIENGWAYEAAPQNFTYDAQVLVGGKPVYTKAALTHFHHARWRRTYWWGTVPQLDVRHNAAYIIASKALPNFDQALAFKESTFDGWNKRWLTGTTGPMEPGVGQAYMMTTGGRPDLGLLPAWGALYLLSQDQRMKTITLGMSEQAGGWSIHYRNKATGKPVTLAEFPYMTIYGNPGDTYNPKTKKQEAFPACPATLCASTMTADTSHQAAFSYLPYLVTGDFYHLEELLFWANFDTFATNPGYRENIKGLFKPEQIRGSAWDIRTVAEAAYITPDSDPNKAVFTNVINYNIDWYDTNYTNNTTATGNKLGVLTHGYAVVYDANTGLAPWQDDYFTASVGHAIELGFTRAQPLLAWKAKFPVDRMTGAGYCWIKGGIYSLKVRDTATSPVYATIAEAYKASVTPEFYALGCNSTQMAFSLGLKVGEMTGYSTSGDGYPAYMQPALAYSVGANSGGAAAWKLFMSRSVKPAYNEQPQFDILPR